MSYAAHADLVSRYGATEILQLADRDLNGVEDPGVVDTALADADQTINSYIRGRYAAQMPFAVVPGELVAAACKLARYILWGNAASDRVAADNTQTLAWLAQIASGVVQLDLPPATAATDDLVPASSAASRTFTRDSLADYECPGLRGQTR